VVRATRPSGDLQIALQIDEILDVAEFAATALAGAPDMGARVPSELLLGLHRAVDDSLTFILDLERILSPAELEEAAGFVGG
jgi:chemotaxis signal transduction protein